MRIVMRFLLLPFMRWASKLRFPTLFKLTAVLFIITLFIPDPIPLLDETLLAMATMLLAGWKKHRGVKSEKENTDKKEKSSDYIDGQSKRV